MNPEEPAPDRPVPGPVRLLLVEDNPGDARLLSAHLEASGLPFELRRAGSLAEAEEALAAARADGGPPDLCFLDLGLPDSRGPGTVERFRRLAAELPVVVLTGLDDEDAAVETARSGAAEHLVKDEVTPRSLARTIRHVLERERIRRERRAAEEKWATVFEASPVPMVVSEAGTARLVDVNDAFVAMFGQPRESMVGSTALGLGHWEDPDRRRALVEKVRREGVFEGEEAWYRDARGRRGRMLLACRRLPLSGEDRLLWTVQDITERVTRERALERRTRELRERVKEQSCLYDVSRLLHDEERPLAERLGDVVERIPAGWQHPEVTAARLRLRGEAHATEGFAETGWMLDVPLEVDGEPVGDLAVAYTEERPSEDLGPFLVEERRLLDEIAEQVEVELSRQAARRKLARVVETMNEAVTIVDADGRISFANSSARRLFSDDGESYVGSEMTRYLPQVRTLEGEPYPADGLPFQTVMRTGEPVTGLEHLIDRGDGDRRAVSVNAAPVPDGGGGLEGVVLSARDITGERARREALRTSEARLRTLVETMAEAVVIVDADGRLVFANPRAGELFGGDPDQLVGRSFDDPVWNLATAEGGPLPSEDLPFARVRATGEPVFDVEFAVQVGDGSRRIASVNAAPLWTEEGAFDGIVATIRDVTDRHRLEEQLRHQALHDPLTGLANRTLLDDRLGGALARARRSEEPLALLMVDLNRFKQVNDSLGHTAGDRVLDEVARRLRAAVREGDTVCRWGGDEFCLLLTGLVEEDDLAGVRERLERLMERPIRVMGREVTPSMTVGAVVFRPGDAAGGPEVGAPDDLLRYADRALHRAKEDSAGSFALFRPEGPGPGGPRDVLAREQELRRGLEEGEFEPFYQPIVRLTTGEVWGVEPLARWRHPERGLVGPAEFIDLAEETGLIHELGRQMLERACRDLAAWAAAGAGSRLRVTPNVSGRQFEDERFVDVVRATLAETGLEPELVMLEVTETSIMRATERIGDVRALGTGVLVDDFGTGYSSLLYLRDLEVDGLKIDMSFVQGLGTGRGNTAIVETTLTLGREMGLRVIAEGIEKREQLDRLRGMGCELGQGYLFGEPVPADEMARRLETAP